MGVTNPVAVDDQGQAIRSSNLTNNVGLEGLAEGAEASNIAASAAQGKSNCILISNMFDSRQVDLEKDPSFFVDIKCQVSDVCQAWGKIDHIYVEQNSPGNVWIRFGGSFEEASSSANHALTELDKRLFDNR